MQPQKSDNPSIAIAGYLAKEKSGYIYKILDKKNKNLVINLYGNKYDETIKKEHMVYHGSFTPEELPNYLIGDFGLVWDGLEANSCVGNTGEYLKYNNPHKTSLYLSSNMPVIVWKKAAIADFIIKNNVGIVVDNLFELEEKISSITLKEYEQICKNTQIISKQLKEGYYFYKALETCLKSLEML